MSVRQQNTSGIEYIPFGETLFEEHLNSEVSPYLFNGKERDKETGFYYYGARYYDPKTSLWLGVDPLAVYDPVNETEYYFDGQHNGGAFNYGNLNPYVYCYQNPITFIDPNGKQSNTTNPPLLPTNAIVQLQNFRTDDLVNDAVNNMAAVGFQKKTDFQPFNTNYSGIEAFSNAYNEFNSYLSNRLNGNPTANTKSFEFNDWLNDDEVFVQITPIMVSIGDYLGTRGGTISNNNSNSNSSSNSNSYELGVEGGKSEIKGSGSYNHTGTTKNELIGSSSSTSNNYKHVYNGTFKLKIEFYYEVQGVASGNAQTQSVIYYYGQNVNVNPNTGNANVSGKPNIYNGSTLTDTQLKPNE